MRYYFKFLITYLILIIIGHLPLMGQSINQNFRWANKAGGMENDLSKGIAVDASGNSYITGSFSGKISFGKNSLTSGGSEDVFIAKYEPSGNLVWAKKGGGIGDDSGQDITVDRNGNIYVTGYTSKNSVFGLIHLNNNPLNFDSFIAKYDPLGNVIWVKNIADSEGKSIAVDDSGNTYVTGNFEEEIADTVSTNESLNYIFISKYDALGNVVWSKSAGGNTVSLVSSIAIDPSGNCYITGNFLGEAKFGEHTLSSTGMNDIFIAKYDNKGNAIWAKRPAGSGTDSGWDISVDKFGNCFVTGTFGVSFTSKNEKNYIIFETIKLISYGENDFFIAKYNSNGEVLWAKNVGGNGEDSGNGITVDNLGNSYLTGTFNGIINFGSSKLTSKGGDDVFITKYDPNGKNVWAVNAGGISNDKSTDIDIDSTGILYITGYFGYRGGSITLGTHSLSGNNSEGNDSFISSFSPPNQSKK